MNGNQPLDRFVSRAINLLNGPETNEANMLETIQISDERTTNYATVTDFCTIFTEEMRSLYLLAFLLTADNDKAEHCFVSGLGDCVEAIGVFMERASSWARRTIFKHAIRMIIPAPEHSDNVSSIELHETATSGDGNVFTAIVGLSPFERFVYVMSILERQSDEDCSRLLRCSRRDVILARELALRRLANINRSYDQPDKPLQSWWTVCAIHHA
jgi:hypothetical protein